MVSNNQNQDKKAERETEDWRFEERSQKYEQVRMQMTKASTLNQPKQTQSPTSFLYKSYIQISGCHRLSQSNDRKCLDG